MLKQAHSVVTMIISYSNDPFGLSILYLEATIFITAYAFLLIYKTEFQLGDSKYSK